MFKNLLQDFCELVYPPTQFTSPPFAPIDFSEDSLVIDGFTIEFNRPPFCVKCSRHLEGSAFNTCPTCRRFNPDFDFALSACLYQNDLKTLIHQFKYQQKTLYRHFFAQVIIKFIDFYHIDIEQFDFCLPVPLSSTRQRERGYNQSALLAQKVTDYYHIPLKINNLERVKLTLPQSDLNQKERWTNQKGAFKINHSKLISGKKILIIDDILTTGATVSEISKTLKYAGAEYVGVITLATTP